ncbi:Uu.00g140610.m01.CDS01 [Anthostomella pinea]|uniref:Uu.00g140610.m01.CDS01 n=1 Tax=Anthostomella pinea TaxID=933095 RepID=A0AAI8YLI9_9PEZI|nr:Uu.00g140610.m01.CDS01 [Anthostomella pinea]
MAAQEPPWYAAYPSPRTTEPASVSREEVLNMLRAGKIGQDVVLVDLRRNDHEPLNPITQGGTIQCSINLPAQSLYPSIPTLYHLFKAAGVRQVIWYCVLPTEGSSRGRGTRAAGWFNDHIQDQGDADMESVILSGGIKGWAGAGGEFVEHMEGYEAEYWKQFPS